tara:strand:- start:1013 stop:2110 length:1098 start_codon:yes stop_codon:yes gene_type:complete
MIYILIFLTIFYFINGSFYLIAIYKLLKTKNQRSKIISDFIPFISIVVPAKNESENIAKCMDSLILQNYPKDRYEIIPVDDGSNDETFKLMKTISKKNSSIKPLKIDSNLSYGKLDAIDLGILHSKGEIILTTDADVWMGNNWLNTMIKPFKQNTGMVVGIAMEETSFNPVKSFQLLDASVIRIISAALVEISKPITCQGANLAFRKIAYLEVREKVLKLAKRFGNREWLMQEMNIAAKWEIISQIDKDSFVYTNSPENWVTLINQRSRWASTGKQYSKLSIRLYLTIIYLAMLSFLLALIFLDFQSVIYLWASKLIIDILMAIMIAICLEKPKLLLAFPIVYFFQPLIVVVSGFLGTFKLYSWK